MRRASRQRLIVLTITTALLGAALWQWQRDARAAPGTLLGRDAASVQRIALDLAGAPTAHYEKRDGHWWRVDGTPRRDDDGRLDELADIASAHVLRWRPAGDFALARIGLAPPAAVVTLDGERVAFGETSVTGPQRYVLVGQRIALVPAHYMPRPPASHQP